MITVTEAIDDYLEITSLQIVSCCGKWENGRGIQ